jgi:transposase-like protein
MRLARFSGQEEGKVRESENGLGTTTTRRGFDEAFKRDAVALLLKGDKKVKQLAKELDDA